MCFRQAPANTSDILNYAVYSMNLPADHDANHDPSTMTRVTYDPVEAQEALDRSFQPFSDQMYSRESRPGKRRAIEDNSIQMDKRYQHMQTYEAPEGYTMS